MKRFICALLLIITVISLSSCTGGSKKDDSKDKGIGKALDISAYTIVRPDIASSALVNVTRVFKTTVRDVTKADLKVITDDTDDSENEYEILLGNTNRKETADALEALKSKTKKEAFIIKVFDKKIAIVGISNEDTLIALNFFMDHVIPSSNAEKTLPLAVGDDISKKTGEVIYASDDGLTVITVEERSDVYVPSDVLINEGCTYGKIIKLEHQADEKNNGILLASKENGAYTTKAKDYRWPVMKSTDDGKTWKEIARIEDKVNKGSTPGYQPCLYELPADVGSFKKGTVLFASCVRTPATTMLLQYSVDQGKTWKGICNVDQGGLYNQGDWSSEGLWEPAVVYEEETGRVYCFYSDELENGTGNDHEGGHNQRLVYKYSTDLVNWSEKFECVALSKSIRAGMISITRMGNGKWVLVYEGCGIPGYGGCPITMKFADALDAWDPEEVGTVVKNSAGHYLSSAPVISWSPAGGECGTLFVTANNSIKSTTDCDLFFSFDYGKTFHSVPNPINILNKSDEYKLYGGYSPGMYVDKEGTLYYVNNPPNPKVKWQEKLEFVRIKIY